MDSFWNVLNVSMIIGICVGTMLSMLAICGVLLIRRGRRKVNLVSCIITAVLASFLSLHFSFFIAEWKLNKMLKDPLEIADTGVRVVSKGIDVLNKFIDVANIIGTGIPQIPETDPDYISKIKEELESHQNNHLIYMGIGFIIAGTLLYFTMDRTEDNKRTSAGYYQNYYQNPQQYY